ncbi:hypothetical protein BU25DRAFT_424084 [Macroventuria anomochaeta]|uniref:Uncharacterized protein n=1 Tax=Macroventuria anomochaeta TaxID=301207 RepID=A0ACB6RQV0_9PLEO|nr:uncharacterized protein BU25DRAFT_424084 [Macroventuria anomochaeta]KAF2624281.1 hypothetical protein BU25DRAFT_424084 [Macroventuria anomochaeta]
MWGDYGSQRELANTMGRGKATLSELLKHVEKKGEELGAFLWEEILYENDQGCWQSSLLTQERKDSIIAIVTSLGNTRKKESWQAVVHGSFGQIVLAMSVTIFENFMYKAGYAQRRPGWKPKLTPEQEEEHYQWALHVRG